MVLIISNNDSNGSNTNDLDEGDGWMDGWMDECRSELH